MLRNKITDIKKTCTSQCSYRFYLVSAK